MTSMMPNDQRPDGRFAFEGLERTIHERARLGILCSLATYPDGLLFTELRQLCTLTDGNLSRHMAILQEAGLLEVFKRSRGKRTQTLLRLTETGRSRFLEYITLLEKIVAGAASAAANPHGESAASGVQPGWSPV